VIKDILDGLESFEKNHGYLSRKITLSTLSKKLGTNPNYLSKVINHYKKSSFTKYLNTLRVEHSIEQLKTNSTYRKYTIKAIAEEVGFNNVQAFAKAFYNSKGINPSYFLKELKKSIQLSDK
jgi:YesN/AraC family two-component response regulator